VYLKRARVLYAPADTFGFVPPWYGERLLALGEDRSAAIFLAGALAPHALDGIDPGLLARDTLPYLKEASKVVNDRTTNWTIAPCPTLVWVELVHPELGPAAALERLWGRDRACVQARSARPRSRPGGRGAMSSLASLPGSIGCASIACLRRSRDAAHGRAAWQQPLDRRASNDRRGD
jgi:hypothetical protein